MKKLLFFLLLLLLVFPGMLYSATTIRVQTWHLGEYPWRYAWDEFKQAVEETAFCATLICSLADDTLEKIRVQHIRRC